MSPRTFLMFFIFLLVLALSIPAISGCSKSNEDLCKEDPVGNIKNCLEAAKDKLN